MKTLKTQIAESIYGSENLEKKLIPKTWRLQIPFGGDRIVLFAADNLSSSDFQNTWVIELDLPKGYETQDYDDALEELFPGTLTEGDRDNQSVRIIKRKYLEDRLYLALNNRNEPISERPQEGIGWLYTNYFMVNPQEDEVDGGRAYFYAQSHDGKSNPVIIDETTGDSTDKGMFFFEFHAPYILKDNYGHREEIAISRTIGGYRVDFTKAEMPGPSVSAW